MSNPIVEVAEGKLKGEASTTPNKLEYFIFKGIPYAKSPVGDLRFAAPETPESWKGVRDATKDCNICAQVPDIMEFKDAIIGDEDCLFLNVYTPKLSKDGSCLPVMVYIHEVGFAFGSGTDERDHDPALLVEKDVVVVTINYRLGILGFLSLDCKEAPGNMGLKDQVQALKWVQKNIGKFNGNSNNVTIFGISSGAASVQYLVLSPLAKGLFHKAIAMSGSTLGAWAINNKIKDLAYKIPQTKGLTLKNDQEVIQYLKKLYTKDLVSASMNVVYRNNELNPNVWRGGAYFGFVPTIEKLGDWEPFLDRKPYDLLSQGEFSKVPFITGYCNREGLIVPCLFKAHFEKLAQEKNHNFLPFDIPETEKKVIESNLKRVYLEGEQRYSEDDSFAIDFFTDVDFFGGAYVSSSLIAKTNNPVFFYEFSYDGGLNLLKKAFDINREGTSHGDDCAYIIGTVKPKHEISETDSMVRNRFLEMWANFAKFGDPTPQVNALFPTKWEPTKENELQYLVIDGKLTMKKEPNPERAQLFKEFYEKYELNAK